MRKPHPRPPSAPKRPKKLRLHGDVREAPYFWLRDRNNPEVLDYIRAENAYTEAVLAPTRLLQQELYAEMRARIREDDQDVPQPEGPWLYYRRFRPGDEYPLHCRRPQAGGPESETVLLDLNEEARDHGYTGVAYATPSPDHRYLAWAVDSDGSERHAIRIKDLATGEVLPDRIEGASSSLAWCNDGRAFFYNALDESLRPRFLHLHRVGEDPKRDKLIYEEPDPHYFVGVGHSHSRRWIFLSCESLASTEWRLIDADHPERAPILVAPRRKGFEYRVSHTGNHLYIRNNGGGARDFKVSRARLLVRRGQVRVAPEKDWEDFVPEKRGRPIDAVSAYRNHLVLSLHEFGLPRLRVIRLTRQDGDDPCPPGEDQIHDVEFAGEAYDLRFIGGREFDSTLMRFTYSSPVTPPEIWDYDMETREHRVLKRTEVRGFNRWLYETRRMFAPARDGARVPITLLARRGTPRDGSSPLVLFGYGAYGRTVKANFERDWYSLVDRGVICAIAHIRGGMEMGWDWYNDGRLLSKHNSFYDFIDCAESLIAQGWTSRDRLAAFGTSAGGLVAGAVANLRPELFRAVIADVPFVDVLNTMLDDTLPLTAQEYSEWGDPRDSSYYDYIKSYSPLENVKHQDYPHLLVLAALNDPRVTYWEPAKWVAHLRDKKTDRNMLLLSTVMDVGHNGASGRFDKLRERAMTFAFFLYALGMWRPPEKAEPGGRGEQTDARNAAGRGEPVL